MNCSVTVNGLVITSSGVNRFNHSFRPEFMEVLIVLPNLYITWYFRGIVRVKTTRREVNRSAPFLSWLV